MGCLQLWSLGERMSVVVSIHNDESELILAVEVIHLARETRK